MAIESGLSVTLTIDDEAAGAKNVSGSTGATNIDTPIELHDVTALDDVAHATISGLSDFTATVEGYFDDAADAWFDIMKTATSTIVTRTFSWALSGQTLAVETLIGRVSYSRARNAEMGITAEFKLQSGSKPTWA
jgi:hypothetical protein|tara:strand:+ start:6340 stop:6744 length:405 start_codon:yes stop_codon:yes gene_type:complete